MSAVSKFNYELKFRKKEFLSECMAKDKKLESKISISTFDEILTKFSTYLNSYEREDLTKRFSLNKISIKYLDIVKLLINHDTDKVVYKHPFLQHLNTLNTQKPELKSIIGNSERLSKVLQIPPIDLLNYKLSEENFIKKTSKDVIEYIMLQSQDDLESTFELIFHKFDHDNDNRYTVGDLNNFLTSCNVQLGDFDLRYLFEFFKPHDGRIDRKHLFSVLYENFESQFSKPANSDFTPDIKKLIREDEMKEERHLTNIILNNRFIAVIYDSLQLLGKISLLKYFQKNMDIKANRFYIDSVDLEMGYVRLGYTDISLEDLNNFKYFLIKKSLGTLNKENTICIELESVFDFVSGYFAMNPNIVKKDSDSLINLFSQRVFKDLSTNFLSYTMPVSTHSTPDSVNEIEFRRRFLNTFGFLDHTFIDSFINHEGGGTPGGEEEFKIGQVSSRKWLEFSYNVMLMGLIKYHDQIGLDIQEDERVGLEKMFTRLERKYFKIPTKHKTIKLSKVELVIDNRQKVELDLKVCREDTISKDIKLLEFKNLNNTKAIVFNNDNTSNPLIRQYKSKKESHQEAKTREANTNVNDTVTFIPILFDKCVDYLKVKYDLAEVNNATLHKLGVCSIFRDHYGANKHNISIKEDVVYSEFVNTLNDLLGDCDLFRFLSYFSSKLKTDKDQINILYFMHKVEEILLQYSKINLK
jgi:hypothetical protein